MPVPSTMADLSTTASSNSPAGSDSPTSGDDYFRALQAIVRTTNAKGSDIASTTTTNIGSATGEFVDVTGTTTITGFGTIAAGIVRTVRFTGALILTHNATSLILPGGANITTANGDVAQFRSLGSGNWKCVGYCKADGTAVSFALADNAVTTTKIADLNVTTAKIADDAVTYAKIQNITTNGLILGRNTAGAGNTEELSLTQILDFIGSAAQGDILYRAAVGWARLGAGTSGQFLKTQGAAANPVWGDVATGGMTLLGTLTTTSGTTQTLSSLTLTNYVSLHIAISGVSFTAGSITMTLGGVSFCVATGTAATVIDGFSILDLTNGIFNTNSTNGGAVSTTLGDTSYNTATTSITFAGGTFDAGSIKVYGVK